MSRYPNFRVSCSLEDFKKKWDYLQKGERDEKSEVLVAGVFGWFLIILRKNYK